jgi:hypothetical protein
MHSNLLFALIVAWLFGLFSSSCKRMSASDEVPNKNNASAQGARLDNEESDSEIDKGYAFWIIGGVAHRGHCKSSQEPQKLEERMDRSTCQVTHKIPADEFEANLERLYLSFTGQSAMSAQDRITMKGGIAAITEDLDVTKFTVPPIDAQKLDELIAKYLTIIEAAIGAKSEVIPVPMKGAELGLVNNIAPRLIINRQTNVSYGRLLYSQRYQLDGSVRTEALAIQLKGNRCGALVTGVTLFDNTGRYEWLVHRGAGIFTSNSNRSLEATQFQFSFSQDTYNWSTCQLEVVQLQDYRSQIPSTGTIHQNGNDPSLFGQNGNAGNGRLVGVYNFQGGLSLQAYLPFQVAPVRTITIDTSACPNAAVSAVRTTPIGQCASTQIQGTNNYIANDCRPQGGGIGAMINGISFAIVGGWQNCQIPVYVQ